MPAPVAQVDPSLEEEQDQKLELYQEEIQHAKVCHIYRKVLKAQKFVTKCVTSLSDYHY